MSLSNFYLKFGNRDNSNFCAFNVLSIRDRHNVGEKLRLKGKVEVECGANVANIVDTSTKRQSIGTLESKLLKHFFPRTHTDALVELI